MLTMSLMKKVGALTRSFSRTDSAPDMRTQPERVVLAVRDGVPPSGKPPVRIFLGTEPAQYRAERIFFWSVEQVRDPGRVYEIYLMKELAGFDRRNWLTGFTNYRFTIPHFAAGVGRAIYNDVDQVYLADPGELFDADLDGHGFLAISDRDTSVMLLDCARMASVWTLEAAQRERRKALEAKARPVPGLWGRLDPAWNARDGEYNPGHSKLLHYTTIHAQPWHPFPQRYVYQSNPVAQVWLDLERAADASGYQVFSASHPSARYKALLAQIRAAYSREQEEGQRGPLPPEWPEFSEENPGLQDFITAVGARTIGVYGLGNGRSGYGAPGPASSKPAMPTVTWCDFAFPSVGQPSVRFDGVVCPDVLDYLPDEDVPWVIEELFGHADRFVYVTLVDYSRTTTFPDGTRLRNRPRELSWWQAHVAAASARYPEIHWTLVLHARTALGKRIAVSREGGRYLGGLPNVWVLTSHKPGHTTQSVGLAQALGWPYTIKELRFTALANVHKRVFGARSATLTGLDAAHSAPLAPPWPDLIIATGWRPARVARWICRQTRGRARLILLGRKGGLITGTSDIVVACPHFRLPSHPRRIETLVPLTHITPERLAQAAERWRDLFDNAPHPRIALLVGGSTARYQLDAETARRMGEQVRAFAEEVGGKVFATTSRRTGPEAAEALLQGLGQTNYVYLWHLNQKENPYLAYLALADVLIVTGESESMLAEAATTDKPVYIYPLPERPPGRKARLKEWVVAHSQTPYLKKKGTVRPQQGLEYLCARLIERGFIQPRRDLNLLHQALVHRSGAHFFGEPLQTGNRLRLREIDAVADKVRVLLGLSAG